MRINENLTYTPPKPTYSGHPVVDIGGTEFAVNRQTHTVNVNALNSQLEQQQIAYVNAKASGNKAAMDAAAKKGAELRSSGATLQVSSAASALQKYYDQSGVKLAISSHNVNELNKQIVQAKNDYAWAQAHNDQAGMAVAAQAGNNLRALGGTIGANVSLVDAQKMMNANANAKTTTSSPQALSTNSSAKQVITSVISTVGGGIYSIVNNASLGLLHTVANDDSLTGNKAYVKGKIGGDAVSLAMGATTVLNGGIKAIGGTITASTGAGAILGGAVASEGLIEVGYGVLITGTSLSNLQNDTMSLAKIRNSGLANNTHPVTGVPFDSDGYPVFDSKFDAKLDPSLNSSSDRVQFKEATNQLNKAIQKDPELAKKFTKEQLKDISNGITPDGYTWHHHQEEGKMQLVETNPHSQTGHTGGRAIWGGGTGNR